MRTATISPEARRLVAAAVAEQDADELDPFGLVVNPADLAFLNATADTQELTDEQIEELLADYEAMRSGVVFEDEAY